MSQDLKRLCDKSNKTKILQLSRFVYIVMICQRPNRYKTPMIVSGISEYLVTTF